MNIKIRIIEKLFTIFSLVFLTGILRWASLFVSPDSKLTTTNEYNPFDPINSLFQYAIYGISLFFLIARGKNSIHTLKGNLLIWLLPIMAMISFLWSDFPDDSLRKGIVTIQTSYFGLYFASRFSMRQQLQLLAWVFGIVAILSLLFGLAFHEAAVETGANAGAFRGPFTQKNLLGRIAILGTIVFLINALHNPHKRLLAWAGVSINILLILLTTSKTALLLLILILLLLPFYKMLRWKTTVTIPIVIMAILIIGSISIIILSNWESSLSAIGRDPSLSGRTGLWEAAIEKISEHPWLGYGYQGFWREEGGASEIWKLEGYKPPHAHNGFINISLDFGLVGLIIFLLILAINYIRAISYLRLSKTLLELWPIYYITFFFMYNHSENTIIEHNSIFWALLVSVIFSMKRHRQSQTVQQSETN